jgi:hypothetical protein
MEVETLKRTLLKAEAALSKPINETTWESHDKALGHLKDLIPDGLHRQPSFSSFMKKNTGPIIAAVLFYS